MQNREVLLLFAILAISIYFAIVQSWGFCKDCGTPKPLLYDIISPVGFWIIGAIVTFPVGIPFGNATGPFFMIIQITYVFILSTVLIHIRKKYLFKKIDKVLIAATVILFLFTLLDMGLFRPATNETVIISNKPPGITFYFGHVLIPTALLILIYGTLLAGAYFYIREKIRPPKTTH